MDIAAWILVLAPAVLVCYAYVVYPALLWLLSLRKGTKIAGEPTPPLVSIVLPAYNEEAQIRGAIEALLAQDYPSNLRQILIISDASTDRTDDFVRAYETSGVELCRMESRKGKTAAENASVGRVRGEIVINTDASVRLHPAAVSRLVAAMSDPDVGVASTHDVSVQPGAPTAGAAEAGYVGYEMLVRRCETRAGGIIGASGSGYAIRVNLHRPPVREDLSRDFSAALTARRHGFRAVSVESALCYVPRTASLSREYRRKVRTISRGMDTLAFNRDLLNPFQHGLFAWKLMSHKLCRWLVPVSAVPATIGLAMLSPDQLWARIALILVFVGALLAFATTRIPDHWRLPRGMAGLLGALAANLAVVHASWRFVHGHDDHIWEPTRRSHASEAT
jgi:cellulose synthase/poly-beta-1,6-N-acetylglucosamine synthase-like glycosyltransferase